MTPSGDRALQDALIRLLADAPFRDAVRALEHARAVDGVPAEHVSVLRTASPERVERYARFVARNYYYERLAHFHRYSRALARWTGRWPEHVLRGAAFEALLPTLVLGSRDAARAVAAIVKEHVASAPNAPPYISDLVHYENVQMVLEAGPRVWRTDEPAPLLDEHTAIARAADVKLLHLAWDLPAILPLLLAGEPASEPPAAERRDTRLVLARTARARVTVLRLDATMRIVLEALAAPRPVAELAMRLALPAADTLDIVRLLLDAGVVAVH